jgi:hypothetical protein
MTPTEKKYRKHIGSLYNYNFTMYWRHGRNIDMIVMPIEIRNHGGWWHYRLQAIGFYPELPPYTTENMIVACKDFLRKATEIKDCA